MHAVDFNAELHEYRVNGERWPSVTEILDPLLELDGIPRAALEAAGRFGNHVHEACHLFDEGVLDEPALDKHLRPYLEAWKLFLRESGAVVVDTERRVHHPNLKYAGTLDKVVRWKRNKRYVLDIKSSAAMPWTVGMQTAGYLDALALDEAFEEVGSPLSLERYCVLLRPDGSYRAKSFNDSRDLNNFVSCLNVHNLRMRYGRQSG